MKWWAAVLSVIILGMVIYVAGRRSVVTDQTYAARVDTVRLATEVQRVAAETVTVRLRAQARVDSVVRVVSDTQLVIRRDTLPPDTVRVPAVVVERLVTDDRTIQSLRALAVADSGVIRSLRALLATPKPQRRYGLGVAVGYGCGPGSCGPTVTLGLAWRW